MWGTAKDEPRLVSSGYCHARAGSTVLQRVQGSRGVCVSLRRQQGLVRMGWSWRALRMLDDRGGRVSASGPLWHQRKVAQIVAIEIAPPTAIRVRTRDDDVGGITLCAQWHSKPDAKRMPKFVLKPCERGIDARANVVSFFWTGE